MGIGTLIGRGTGSDSCSIVVIYRSWSVAFLFEVGTKPIIVIPKIFLLRHPRSLSLMIRHCYTPSPRFPTRILRCIIKYYLSFVEFSMYQGLCISYLGQLNLFVTDEECWEYPFLIILIILSPWSNLLKLIVSKHGLDYFMTKLYLLCLFPYSFQ